MVEPALRCINHPSRPTSVRCSSCDSPICVSCMRESAVGIKCPSCARPSRQARRLGKPRHLVLAAAASLGVGLIGGAALALFSGGFFGFLLPLLLGLLVGEATLRASSGLSHTPYRVIAGAGAFLGVLFGPMLLGVPLGLALGAHSLIRGAIAAFVAVGRLMR